MPLLSAPEPVGDVLASPHKIIEAPRITLADDLLWTDVTVRSISAPPHPLAARPVTPRP